MAVVFVVPSEPLTVLFSLSRRAILAFETGPHGKERACKRPTPTAASAHPEPDGAKPADAVAVGSPRTPRPRHRSRRQGAHAATFGQGARRGPHAQGGDRDQKLRAGRPRS